MDRYSAMQLEHQNYIATVLNSRQYRNPLKRGTVLRTEKRNAFDDATTSVTYEPPPLFSNTGTSSSSKEEGTSSGKLFQRLLFRRKMGRARSEGYIYPNPLRTTNTGSLKEINIDHSNSNHCKLFPKSSSERGFCRAHKVDINFHPNQEGNGRIDPREAMTKGKMVFSVMKTDITIPSPLSLTPDTSSSSISAGSTLSFSSQSSCTTGNNLYNSLSKTIAAPNATTIMSDGSYTGKDLINDCSSIARTVVTTSGDENDYNISLSSLNSIPSYPKLSNSFCRLLSSMSNDSLVIAENSEDVDEDDINTDTSSLYDETTKESSSNNNEKLENNITNDNRKKRRRRRRRRATLKTKQRDNDDDKSIATAFLSCIDLRKRRNNRNNHSVRSILQRETEKSLCRYSE